nr:hypothetical protein [Tanacetum cinerariifolium]
MRRDLQFNDEDDETVHEERGDRVERAPTTIASLEVKQDSGTINRTQSTAIPNEPIPKGTSSGGRPRCQYTILRDTPAQTRDCRGCSSFVNSKVKEESQEVGKEEKVKNSTTQEEGRYGHDIEVNTASTSITTAIINLTAAKPVTTTLMKMKSVKSNEKSKEKGVSSTRVTKGVIMKEASEIASRPIVPPQQQLDPKDKGKEVLEGSVLEGSGKKAETCRKEEVSKKRTEEEFDQETFDMDDLVMLWSLVKEKFNLTELADDKEREILVELKRLFEPDTDDELWKL